MRFNPKEIKNLFLGLDRKKLILIVVSLLIILILDFSFILSAQIKANRAISIKINKLKNELKSFKKDLALMQESLKKKTAQLPRTISETELSWLMEELYNLASKNKIEISHLKPQKEVKPSVSLTGSIPYLLQMSLNSDYYSLLNFIQSIEEHRVIMMIEELDILQNPRDIFRHNINLIIKVYVRK